MRNEKPVGICPECGEAVYNSHEGDAGPVWTCPADLSEGNPYHKPTIMTAEQIEQNEHEGYFGLCCEDSGNNRGSCYDRLPLHSACYDKGDY